jgi:toxin ParE1/3/4
MRVRLLEEAETESQEAARWYEERQAGLGQQFLDALAHALEIIERQPQAFSRVSTNDATREVRRCVLQRFPYLIFYEVRAEEVLVLAVAHARRRPNYWQDRRE